MGNNVRMAWGMAIVEGLSMIPTYAPGERLLVHYGGTFTIDDVVLIQRPDQVDVKRINKVIENRIYVIGDNLDVSIDSRHYGPLTGENVIAKVVWRLPRFLRKRS